MSQDPQKQPPDPDETDALAERLRALSQGEHAEAPSPPSSAFDQVDFAAPPPPPPPPPRAPASKPIKPTPPPRPKPPRPHRPEHPTPASDLPPEPPTSYSSMPLVREDDDDVIVPAPSAQHLGPRDLLSAAPRAPYARSLFFRRTMIPILLTLGVMLPGLAILWFASDPASTVRASGRWLPVTLIVLGAILLLLAIVNMAQVKHLLRERDRSR